MVIYASDISGNTATFYGANSLDGCFLGEAKDEISVCKVCPVGKYSLIVNADECS